MQESYQLIVINKLKIMIRLTSQLGRSFSSIAILDYNDLKEGKKLFDQIEKSYGPKGHGILFVKNIPDFIQTRRATLPLFHQLANLPPNILSKYARPEIFHSLGWSCGVEQFQGRYDTSKGSYYVNCCTDEPVKLTSEQESFYSENEKKMNVGNKWVDEIPEIQKNVKALSKLMINTGILLARQIDGYVEHNVPSYEKGKLTRIIERGHGHIGRMLHYFPFQEKGDAEDDWCGWHNDHGSLTALTSAMYTDKDGKQYSMKTNSGGVYAQNRFTDMVRIGIPHDMLAFQLGECTQIHTGGYLEATPHCVIRSEELAGKNIGRNTFALFMEPDHLERMSTPEGVDAQKVMNTKAYKIPQLKQRWDNGIFFKDFHQRTIQRYS